MSKGKIVEISEGNVDDVAAGFVGGTNILLEQWLQTMALVNTTKSSFDSGVAGLQDILGSLKMPDGWEDLLSDVAITDISSVPAYKKLEMGTLDLPGFEGVIFPQIPGLKSVPKINIQYDKPVKPADINTQLGFMQKHYTSEMWLNLFEKVNNDIISGGTGLDPVIEELVYRRDTIRKYDAVNEAYAIGLKEIRQRGIKFSGLAVRSLQAKIGAMIARAQLESSTTIAIDSLEREQNWKKFILESATNLESVLRDFHIKEQSLTLEAKKAAAQLAISLYAERLKAYIAEWEGITSEAEAKIKVIESVVAENDATIKGFTAQIQGALGQVELITNERNGLIEARKSDAEIYVSNNKALTDYYNALTENQKAKLEKSRLEIDKAATELKAIIDSELSINSLKERVLEALSNVSAQVLSAALNAVNTSVTHGTSTSENTSEQWTHGKSLRESHAHTYVEKVT